MVFPDSRDRFTPASPEDAEDVSPVAIFETRNPLLWVAKQQTRKVCYLAHASRSAEQAMPPGQTLDGETRLEERERPGWDVRSSMQNPVALGAKRSASPVKGGIARAPGLLAA